jgi:hypothetical protein
MNVEDRFVYNEKEHILYENGIPVAKSYDKYVIIVDKNGLLVKQGFVEKTKFFLLFLMVF